MRITACKTFKCSIPTGQDVRDGRTGEMLSSAKKSWLFLKVETDAGISGWGEGSGEWLVPSVDAVLQQFASLLVDCDPLRVAALTDDVFDRVPWKGGPVFGTAAAAINMALYDIAGKAWGAPVHALLGGSRRQSVRVYTGGVSFDDPEQSVRLARQALERGYCGIKGNPLEARRWPMDGEAVDRAVAAVAAVRQALGREFEIALDAHGAPAPELGLELARGVAPHRPLFLEEPVKVGSTAALLEVSHKSPVPIAAGEKLFSFEQFAPLIEERACAFLQPDVGHCFGITAAMEIARAANRQQMLMAPHMTSGPVAYAATLALDAAIPNFLVQETNYFEMYNHLAEHPWEIKGGSINISDEPGLGIHVKEQDLCKYPYEPMPFRQYRYADGSWKGW
jgi:galactonate dehydratase